MSILGKSIVNNLRRPTFGDVLKEVPRATSKVGKGIGKFLFGSTAGLLNTAGQNLGQAAAYYFDPMVRKQVDLGEDILPALRTSQGQGLKQIAGQMLGSAAEVLPFAQGAQILKAAKPQYLKLALQGAKSGLGYGLASGAGEALQRNAGASEVILSALKGGGIGTLAGAALAPALGYLGAHGNEPIPLPDSVKSLPKNQAGFVKIPSGGTHNLRMGGGAEPPIHQLSPEGQEFIRKLRDYNELVGKHLSGTGIGLSEIKEPSLNLPKLSPEVTTEVSKFLQKYFLK